MIDLCILRLQWKGHLTVMTIKECENLFIEYRKLVERVRFSETRLKFLTERVYSCGAMDLTEPRVQGGKPVPLSELIAIKLDYEDVYKNTIKETQRYAEYLYNLITKYVENELNRQVMIMYYIELMDINVIATTLKYTLKHIYKIKRNTLKDISEKIGEPTNEIRSNNTTTKEIPKN